MKNENRGYDPKAFTVSTKRVDVALLPNIGRFCACGCGKRIEKILRIRMLNGKKVIDHISPKNQKYATAYCRNKVNNKKHESKYSLIARIPLIASNNMRIITIYVKGRERRQVAITKSDKAIWNLMESLQRKSKNE